MRGMAVNIRVPVDPGWRAGGTLQIYTDNGSGTIDTAKPLLRRRFEMFPGTHEAIGYGGEPFGAVPYGGGAATTRRVGGYGDQPHGGAPYGGGTAYVSVRAFVDEGFGLYKFAAESYDAAGNVQAGALVEFTQLVSGDDPPPLSALAFSSYDNGTDVVTFSITQ